MRGEPTNFKMPIRPEGQDAREQLQGGVNPAPTRAPLVNRGSSPDRYATSGMERAMSALADKTHKPKRS